MPRIPPSLLLPSPPPSLQFFKQLVKSGLVKTILEYANFAAMKGMKKAGGTKKSTITGIPKLDDANNAGGKKSKQCTLILTEGDSAKALAVSGLAVVGRDNYGVFPLRGKLLNVRDVGLAKVRRGEREKRIV